MTLEQNTLPGNLGERVRPLPSPDARVALYCCDLADDGTLALQLGAWLSPAEHARAARFGTEALRRRYMIGRATLRALLGRRLRIDPAAVPLARGRRGRPQLAGPRVLDFNVSHTRGVLVAGLASGITIGIDIEHVDRVINTEGIARRCLAPPEQAVVARLAPDDARRDVLRRWTCKEAMSKATGDAMAAPFRRLDVKLGPHPVLQAGPQPYDPPDWALRTVPLDGYFVTLALWSDRSVDRQSTERPD